MQMTEVFAGGTSPGVAAAVLAQLRDDIEHGLSSGRIPAMVVVRGEMLAGIGDFAIMGDDIEWGPDGRVDAFLDVPFEIGTPETGGLAAVVYADEIDLS
jgi:hypothetical protein